MLINIVSLRLCAEISPNLTKTHQKHTIRQLRVKQQCTHSEIFRPVVTLSLHHHPLSFFLALFVRTCYDNKKHILFFPNFSLIYGFYQVFPTSPLLKQILYHKFTYQNIDHKMKHRMLEANHFQ